jgi:transcriptional regulator with XRE-family HTH domain
MGIELNELHQKIGAELKRMRLLAGFSSYEVFADKNKLSKIQYFKMEKGTNFTLKSLDRILKIHDISIINFFHKFDKETKTPTNVECVDRIIILLDSLQQSKLEFSKSIGFSNANQINAILSGRNNISAKLAYQIEKIYPQFKFSWILNGEGEMV